MSPGRVFSLLLVNSFYLLFSLWCFVHFLRKFLRWRKDAPISRERQLLILLPPVLMIAALILPPLVRVPEEIPVPRGELKELTAQVDTIRQYAYKRRRGTHYAPTFYYEYRHYIYLKGHSGTLLVPENFGFDQEKFLDWAGTGSVTFRYALTGGHTTAYEIQGADGSFFLTYAHASDRLWAGAAYKLTIMLSGALLLGAGAVYLPAYLYPPEGDWRKRWRRLGLLALAVLTILAVDAFRKPKVTETPAGGPPPVVVEAAAGIRFTLPQGWEEWETNGSGTQWYRVQEGVSTCFRIHRSRLDLSQGVWRQAERVSLRDHLLDTYVTQPRTDLGPFLHTLFSSSERVPGTEFWVSEGWGASESGAKNHFLLVFLPERRAMVNIQSCSSSPEMSWGELEEYVKEYIWPLLTALEAPEE